MKVSLVVTVLNEEKSIESFLDSVAKQKLWPDEFIVVDGGSGDWTIEKLERSKVRTTIVIKKGANRSEGRNYGVELARNEIIVGTDAGCILDENWLYEITRPFLKEEVKVVSGFYLPVTKNIFQKCVAPYFCVMKEEIEKRMQDPKFEFLPSSRSIAFKKHVWAKVGGYPSNLNYCEDLVFDQKLKAHGFRIHFAPKAIVYWPQRDSVKSVFKQFFNYAVGDGQVFFSEYQTHSAKITLIFLRTIAFFALFLMTFLNAKYLTFFLLALFPYLVWSVYKNYNYVRDLRALYYLPFLQFISDAAVLLGTIKGLLQQKNVTLS